jgi:two-component system chemotaxis sensor kinase CheA
VEFFRECDNLMKTLQGASRDRQHVLRALHTLKGNALTFGVKSLAEAANALETRLVGGEGLPSVEELAPLNQAWLTFSERMTRLLGTTAEPVVEVASSELEALLKAAEAGAPSRELAAMLARLKLERAPVRLRRIGEQARSLAERLGKGALRIDVHAQGDVRFDRERWSGFWAAFIHPIRNAVDHGIELPEERKQAGKQVQGRLSLSVVGDAESIRVELSDDGRGVDFEKVRSKARALGLPHESEAQLTEALFNEGFTTRDEATELSGRGLGMSALREAARSLGGVVSVSSRAGQGTTLRVRFPSEMP